MCAMKRQDWSPMEVTESPGNRRRSCPPNVFQYRSYSMPTAQFGGISEDLDSSWAHGETGPEPMQISPESSFNHPTPQHAQESPLMSLSSAFLDLATSLRPNRVPVESSGVDDEECPTSGDVGQSVLDNSSREWLGRSPARPAREIPGGTPAKSAGDTPGRRQSSVAASNSTRKRFMGRPFVPGVPGATPEAGVDPGGNHDAPPPIQPDKASPNALNSKMENTTEPNKRKTSCLRRAVFFLLFCSILCTVIFSFNTGMWNFCGKDDLNVTSVGLTFEHRVFGQHIATEGVLHSLTEFLGNHLGGSPPLVLSFHGWTGIGKNHVSNIVASHLPERCVERVIVPLHFPHSGPVYENRRRIHDMIVNNMARSTCCWRLFIVDEVDKADEDILSGLRQAISHIAAESRESERSSGDIFFLLSNTGGNMINRFMLDWILTGHRREEVRPGDLAGVVDTLSTGSWVRGLAQAGLVTRVLPFLPLQREQVRQCLLEYASAKGLPPIADHVRQALDSLMFFPEDTQLFSRSGCKKISYLFDLARDVDESKL